MLCSLRQFNGVTTLWTFVVCSKGEILDLFHKTLCLMGQCLDCEVKNLKFCPIEIPIENIIAISLHRACGHWEK